MGEPAHGFLAKAKRKQFLLFLLALTALGGVSVLVYEILTPPAKTAQNSATAQSQGAAGQSSTLADAAKDSDGDGLKDWEEALYGTDSGNPDTDRDGTPDGQEVAVNRDPLKKGPNDSVKSEGPNPKPEPADDNLTFNLTKNLLESGVLGAIDQSGNLTSADFLDTLHLPNNLDPDRLLAVSPISAKNIPTSSENDAAAVKRYFNALYAVYAKYIIPHQARGDLAILAEALQSGKYEKLAELDPLIRALEKTIGDITKIPTPSDFAPFAVKELNFLLATKRAIGVFRNTQNDPLATALVVRRRIELFQEMARLHRETKADLDQRGITFSPVEGGYAYFQ